MIADERRTRNGNWRYGVIASLPLTMMIVSGCGEGAGGSDTEGSNLVPVAINSASLAWSQPTTKEDGSPLTDIAGYKVYYAQTTPVTATNSQSITIDDPNQESYVVSNLSPGTNYFTVTAFDLDGNESSMSDEVSKTIYKTI